ncbi:RhoGAP-domain-containing protein [Paraphaeosphaeria sporulosa]|uniref:RhoGAP-domain-containing protein n=1 Tax=Paraphaeosphaeria sporulosa TaxID=1460663 RepID=A0A177C7Y7_9PLEO|nr:RhoGAP-domain-containing protein [Paraphaeosphaeria sporulosa]OAG02867.1 RhoGAP-domain-containing protein [Paraphaeosphaeria sporulosa]
MPNGAHNSHGAFATPRVRNGEPQPAPVTPIEPGSAKRDLTSWWKQFSKRSVKKEEEKEPEVPRGIFGVPLITSIPYANVAISLFNESGESYIYGYVPIVVAKCGVFLKEKATDVEGIFRLAGSEKRIKELKAQFDAPPRWGKGLDWSGYTVHDAANILRRYFNQLPEPIIPLQYYQPFRDPLRGHQAEAVGHIEGQGASLGGFDPDAAVRVYQQLIKELPSLNRQLLLYILDLLAVFAAKSDVNKMTTSNLAAIFQPGILSHPQHDMSPQDYRLSQDVLIFLIDNQDHFLIGMEGTAVDEGTVKHIESGPSTPQARTPTTPGRNKSGLGRSASAASSAAAESLRKFGGVRRNVSTSSRHSRHSGAVPSPTTPAFTPSSGVHRSNTLPSKRSPALTASRFPRERGSDPPTPAAEDPKTQLPAVTPEIPTPDATALEGPPTHIDLPKKEATLPVQPVSENVQAAPRAQTFPIERLDVAKPQQPPPVDTSKPALPTPALDKIPGAFPLPSPGLIPPTPDAVTPSAASEAANILAPPAQQILQRSPRTTPRHERSEFMEGAVDSGPPAEASSVVRTFTQILAGSRASPASDEKQPGRKPNKLQKKRITSANPSAHSSTHSLTGSQAGFDGPPSPLPEAAFPLTLPGSSKDALQSANYDTISSRNSGATLKPTMSPSASFRSHSTATEYSEAEQLEEPPKEEKEKRSFWKHTRGGSKATPTASQTDLHGSVPGGDKSMSSFGSSSGWGGGGRRSLQYDSHQSSDLSVPYGESKEAAEKKKIGPLAWLDRKRQEHDERKDKKNRAKSPPGSSSELATPYGLLSPKLEPTARGRSMDAPRSTGSNEPRLRQDSSDITPTGTTPNSLTETTMQLPQPQSPSHSPLQAPQEEQEKRSTAPPPPPSQQQQSPEPSTSQASPPTEQRPQQQPAPEAATPQPDTTVDAPQEPPRRPSPNKSGLYPLDADIEKTV